MAPKGKSDKGKGAKTEEKGGAGKVKPAQQINVRHIMVRRPAVTPLLKACMPSRESAKETDAVT